MARSKELVKPTRMRSYDFNPSKKRVFLTAFENNFSIRKASEIAGVHPDTVRKHRKTDEEFNERFEAIEADITALLEEEAMRRAVNGVKKAVYYQGKLVGYELEYSDRLLEMMLRARDQRYNTRTIQAEHKHEVNVTVNAVKEKLLEKALSRGVTIDVTPDNVEDPET